MRNLFIVLISAFLFINNYASNISPEKLEQMNRHAAKIDSIKAILPYYQKKIDDFILTRLNKIEDAIKRGEISDRSKISSKFSGINLRINQKGALKVQILLPDTLTKNQFEEYKKWLIENNVEILESFYPTPEIINCRPFVSCYILYDKIYDISNDNRTAAITTLIEPLSKVGDETTEGDVQLNALLARQQKGVDGAGIKVGVISDGIQDFEQSQSSGDLGSVHYYSGHEQIAGYEGRAMMEIVYDLAPNCELWFGSYRYGAGTPHQMTTTVNELITAGCKIIVDDVGFPGEPWFQDGELAQHLTNKIEYDNIIYISAAGNQGKSMYTGTFNGDTDDWHIFYNTPTPDIQNKVITTPKPDVQIFLQWADEWSTPDTDYDLYLYDPMLNPIGEGGKTIQGPGYSNPPIELVTYTNSDNWSFLYIRIKKVSGYLRKLKVTAYPCDLDYTHDYNRSDEYQICGHEAATSVISVAAYPSYDLLHLEDFSSWGPTVLYRAYGPEVERQTPTITATDYVLTTLEDEGFSPFAGTSASAPHIAGIAALYLKYYGYNPNSPENFMTSLTSSATGIDGGVGGVWNNHSGYGKADAYEALGGGPLNIRVDQQNSGSTSIDSIKHWENPWNTYRAYHDFSWDQGSNQILKASVKVINNEKFHDWNDNSSIINHEHFTIDKSTTGILSQFAPVVQATVKTNLISGGSGGKIKLKDSWLPVYNESPYGIKNLGMADSLRTYVSPLVLNFNSQFKGVFSNQNPLFEFDKPIYSVSASATQIIPFYGQNITWYFQGWSGDANKVAFQYPNQTETAVVFKTSDAIAQANYKGHLASSKAEATSLNNSRRLVRNENGGTYHLLYEDNNEIWYTYSTDGTNWQPEQRISDAAIPNSCTSKYPALAIEPSRLHAVWEYTDYNGYYGVEHYLIYRTYNGSSWSSKEYLPADPLTQWYYLSSETIVPSICAEYQDNVFITWKIRSIDTDEIQVLAIAKNNGQWSNIFVVSGINGHPALEKKLSGTNNPLRLVWSDGSNIKLKAGDYNYTSRVFTWGSTQNVTTSNPSYYRHENPSLVVDETNVLHISWQARELTGQQRYYVCHKDDQFNYITNFFKTSYKLKYPSVTANTANGNVRLAYQAETTYNVPYLYTRESPYTIYYWSPELLIDSPARHASYEPRGTNSRLVYTAYMDQPYIIKTSRPYSQKVKASSPEQYYRSIDVPFKDVMGKDGQVYSGRICLEVDFSAFQTDLKPLDGVYEKFLRTPDLSTESDKISYRILLYDLTVMEAGPAEKTNTFNIGISLNGENGNSLIRKTEHDLSALLAGSQDSNTGFVLDCAWSTSDQKEVYVQFDVPVENMADAVYAQSYLSGEKLEKSGSENTAQVVELLPLQFRLYQAYPNPFNARTTLAYDLPRSENVMLTVYDINGKRVATLVHKFQPAGSYQLSFDGNVLASGIYIYELQAGSFRQVRKMMLVK